MPPKAWVSAKNHARSHSVHLPAPTAEHSLAESLWNELTCSSLLLLVSHYSLKETFPA